MEGGRGALPSQISLLPAKFGEEGGLNILGPCRGILLVPTGMLRRTRGKACVSAVFANQKCNTAFGWGEGERAAANSDSAAFYGRASKSPWEDLDMPGWSTRETNGIDEMRGNA